LKYPDRLLLQIGKPARYTGHEWNIKVKDWDNAAVRIALGYPDLYEIGMSNMALQVLYSLLNREAGVVAERFFTPWVDMTAALRQNSMPLLSLETGRPLADFDVIGFSIGYELTFTNILTVLDLTGIPLCSAQRTGAHPLVIAGGSAVFNPEPVTDFIDMFFIGEAENALPGLLELMKEHRNSSGCRIDKPGFLRAAAALPGVYVPSLYAVEYLENEFQRLHPSSCVPERVERQIVNRLPFPPTDTIVPYIEIVHDRAAVEISRGCSRGCRFCSAGSIYRPVRERPQAEVLEAVDEIIESTGYDEVSLVSLSSGDYTHIDELVAGIAGRHGDDIAISLPSLRLDEHSVRLVEALPGRRKSGLTFAPEAGSPRMQRVINKHIPEDELLSTAALAFSRGWPGLKLYFMLGLPTEADEDAAYIVELVRKVQLAGSHAPGRRPKIRLSIATFVPKPHTPFQWASQIDRDTLLARLEIIRHGLGRRFKVSYQDYHTSLLEAVMSRGDRRLGEVVYLAWRKGAMFDGWSECFNFNVWQEAFDECGLDPAWYAMRQRPLDEPLPWSHIDIGITPDFLEQDYRRSLSGELTPYCKTDGCNLCGLQDNPACL
jgi:radical SAM family uncharacterized protein